jgi:hypothetical protein
MTLQFKLKSLVFQAQRFVCLAVLYVYMYLYIYICCIAIESCVPIKSVSRNGHHIKMGIIYKSTEIIYNHIETDRNPITSYRILQKSYNMVPYTIYLQFYILYI